MNDDPDESTSSRISDTERSQKDAQTVDEESLTLSGKDAEQVALEVDLNQKKRRRKKQDGANELEVNNLLVNIYQYTAPLCKYFPKGNHFSDFCDIDSFCLFMNFL